MSIEDQKLIDHSKVRHDLGAVIASLKIMKTLLFSDENAEKLKKYELHFGEAIEAIIEVRNEFKK